MDIIEGHKEINLTHALIDLQYTTFYLQLAGLLADILCDKKKLANIILSPPKLTSFSISYLIDFSFQFLCKAKVIYIR